MDDERRGALYAVPALMLVAGAALLLIGAAQAPSTPQPHESNGCPQEGSCPYQPPPPPTINPVPLVGAGLAIAGVMVGMALQVWRGDDWAGRLWDKLAE